MEPKTITILGIYAAGRSNTTALVPRSRTAVLAGRPTLASATTADRLPARTILPWRRVPRRSLVKPPAR